MTRKSSLVRVVSGSLLVLSLLLGPLTGSVARAQDQAADTPGSSTNDEENAFTSASFAITGTDVHIDLSAVRSVGATRVRTESGFIRVWFDDMTGWTALELEGDGGAIRSVRTRQGAGDSNVVIVRVGDGRRVSESDVRVTREGTRASIVVARSALPAARGLAAPTVAVEAPAAITAEPDAAPDDAAPDDEIVEPAPAAEVVGTRDALRALAHTRADEATASLGLDDAARGPQLGSLLAVTVLLLLALGAVRLYQSRRASKGLEPSIRIIAATRLSPKQQLVVVRALGQDHLLAIEPGRTERLISIATPVESAPAEEPLLELRLSREPGPTSAAASVSQALSALPLAQTGMSAPHDLESYGARSAAHAPTLFGRTLAAFGLGARPSTPVIAPSPLASIAPAGPASFATTPFGRELARLVESRAETPLPPTTSMPPGAGSAVAGLVRLRAQAQAGRA